MIQDKYYLYQHIRLDKNEPFYVGIGAKTLQDFRINGYHRANKKVSRSEFWNKIVNKTPYKVEILFETNDRDLIKQKEIELIKLYGRKNLGTGILVNLTDGGDGMQCCRVKKLCKELFLLNKDFSIQAIFECAKDFYDYIKSGNYRALREVCSSKKLYYKGYNICYSKDYEEIKILFSA